MQLVSCSSPVLWFRRGSQYDYQDLRWGNNPLKINHVTRLGVTMVMGLRIESIKRNYRRLSKLQESKYK